VHDLIPAAPEVVVQAGVLGVQLVIDRGPGGVGEIGGRPGAAHGRGGGRHVGVGSGRDGRVDGRAERGSLRRPDHGERAVDHIGVDLHDHGILDKAAGGHELGDRDTGRGERVDDHPGAERGGLKQRLVDLGGAGGQGEADDDAGQARVDQHRPVAAKPVQRDQAMRARRLRRRLSPEQLEDGHAAPGRLVLDGGGDVAVGEPGEDVADAALAGLVSPQARDDAAVDGAAHAGDLVQALAIHDVTRRGAHDRDQLAGGDRAGRGDGDVGVHVADGYRDAFGQASERRRCRGEAAGPGAQGSDYGVSELAFGEASELRVELAEELARRILAILVDALVAGGAGVAGLGAAQLPDDPVRGLDPAVRLGVDLGVFLQQLEGLGELPLGGDLAAVPADPRFLAVMRQRVDPVRVRLGGVMLPQLRVRVRACVAAGELTQGSAGYGDREAGGRGEVGGDANDLRGIDACPGKRGGYRLAERGGPVGGVLQRPVRRQPGAR
jgi:hypothetical protein